MFCGACQLCVWMFRFAWHNSFFIFHCYSILIIHHNCANSLDTVLFTISHCAYFREYLDVMANSGGTVESLDEIPSHVWTGLPDCLSLGYSAVNQSRIGE